MGAYTTAFRGPLQRHRTRRTPLLLSVSPASCSHVGKAQAAAAAAAALASVDTDHRARRCCGQKNRPGEGLVTEGHTHAHSRRAGSDIGGCTRVRFKLTVEERWPVTESGCGWAPGLKPVSIDPSGGGLEGNSPPLAEVA